MRNQIAWVPEYVLELFTGDIAQFPAYLQPMIQVGYLEQSFDDFLVANNGYWASSDFDDFSEEFERNRGVTITRTRPGLKAPIAVATDNTSAQTPFNNGITASDFAIEQYTFSPFELTDGIDLDLIGQDFAIVKRFPHQVTTSYHQGYQSVDLLARDTYIASYAAGSTIVPNAVGPYTAGSNVDVEVDDLRAFTTVITVGASSTNGVITPVSSSVKLPITIYPAGSQTGSWTSNYELTTADVSNASNFVPANLPVQYGTQGAPTAARGNGVSGKIRLDTIPGGKSISSGDVIVAGDAAAQVFAAGVLHFSLLPQSNSGLASTNLLDAVNILENNGVPYAHNQDGDTEGTYCAHGAPNVFRSLYNDADFKQANQTLGQSEIYVGGKISKYLGVTFLPNTNAPRIPLAAYGGTGYAYLTLITGDGAIVDRWYAGLQDWAMSEFNPAYVVLDRGIAFTFMPAYGDRQGRRMHIDWLTIRDMVCPTDVTRSSVILTGNGARRARAVAVWTWAAN